MPAPGLINIELAVSGSRNISEPSTVVSAIQTPLERLCSRPARVTPVGRVEAENSKSSPNRDTIAVELLDAPYECILLLSSLIYSRDSRPANQPLPPHAFEANNQHCNPNDLSSRPWPPISFTRPARFWLW